MAAAAAAVAQVGSELPEALATLGALQEQVTAVTSHIYGLLQRVQAGDYPTEKGLSFLELRPQLLLCYLQGVSELLLNKVGGRPLTGHPALLRLVETRTVLEKMRPIEQKLRYQVDKLVKAAVTGALGDDNPLRFKPDPSSMISKLREEDEEEEKHEAKNPGKKPAARGGFPKYVPPRMVPVHYDETGAERERKAQDHAKRRALSSSVIRELKEQFSEAPEEIQDGRCPHVTRQSREDQHRREYEESMLIRLNMSRQEKARRRWEGTRSSQLHGLTHFGDISALTGAAPLVAEDMGPQKKKRKKVTGKGGKKKSFHRRR